MPIIGGAERLPVRALRTWLHDQPTLLLSLSFIEIEQAHMPLVGTL